MTNKEILDLANKLARQFYSLMGYQVPDGYRFDQATHPQEVLAWQQAKAAFEMLRHTDVDDAITSIEEYTGCTLDLGPNDIPNTCVLDDTRYSKKDCILSKTGETRETCKCYKTVWI